MRTRQASNRRAARSWPRRHPVATAFLGVVAVLVGLLVAFPSDEASRWIALLGGLIFAIPIAAVVLLVTWLLDRRAARSADQTDDEPAPYTAPVWPPAAAPVTPRDASSLWRGKPAGDTPPPAGTSFAGASQPVDGPPTLAASPPLGAFPPVSSPLSAGPSAPVTPRSDVGSMPVGGSQEAGASTSDVQAPPAKPTHSPTHVPPVDPVHLEPIHLGAVRGMSPTELEQLSVRLLLDLGYADLRRSDDAGDRGADIVGLDRQGRSVVVECRRHEGDMVGTQVIEAFVGVMAAHQADRGIVITTAAFSGPAARLAERHGILLIAGDDLVTLLNLTGTR